jgi:hypothetical protein
MGKGMSEVIQTEFTISYDALGDLQHHQINAKDLGNAIIGMSDLIQKSAEIVSNGSSEASLKVLAPAKEGSLEIVFAIVADPITTLAVLKTIGIGVVGAVAAGATAIGIMDRIKDKKIENVTIDAETQTAVITTSEGSFETTSKVAQLVSSKEIRQALHKVIQAPLQGRENAKISFISEQATLILNEPEIKNFNPIKTDAIEEEQIEIFQKTVQFTKLNFQGKRGWSIQSNDGLITSVSIQDELFLSKVLANEEAFQKDKFYMVDIEHRQITNLSGTRHSYAIVRVINELNP